MDSEIRRFGDSEFVKTCHEHVTVLYLKYFCHFQSFSILFTFSQLSLHFKDFMFYLLFPTLMHPTKVPFHGTTSPYSYFEIILRQHDQKKLSAELNWKVCWQSLAMFCLSTYQICCRVKLIPWNVVNLRHLYGTSTCHFLCETQNEQGYFKRTISSKKGNLQLFWKRMYTKIW